MTNQGQVIAESAIQFVRLLPAPPDKTWTFLTEPARVAEWYGEGVIETREGGKVELMGGHIRGVVTGWRPQQFFAHTWNVFAPGETISGWPVSYPIVNPITPADNRFRSIGHSAFCADAEVRDYVLNLCDHEALIQRQAAASRLAQEPRGGGQQAANDRHQDQIGNEIRDEHQGQPSPQGNHPPRLLAIHEHPHSDGPEDK